jgi:P27 family predicted phage terminase small subunit
MPKRGPKPRTASNTRKRVPTAGLWEGFGPPFVGGDPAGPEFHRLVANLRRVGTLDRTDPQMVVSAARAQATLDESYAIVAAEGLTTVGGHGSPCPHPLLGVINQMTIRLRGLYNDMGLTAASSKHGNPAAIDTPEDGWGDLLAVG